MKIKFWFIPLICIAMAISCPSNSNIVPEGLEVNGEILRVSAMELISENSYSARKVNVHLALRRVMVNNRSATDIIEKSVVVDLEFRDIKPAITYEMDLKDKQLFRQHEQPDRKRQCAGICSGFVVNQSFNLTCSSSSHAGDEQFHGRLTLNKQPVHFMYRLCRMYITILPGWPGIVPVLLLPYL